MLPLKVGYPCHFVSFPELIALQGGDLVHVPTVFRRRLLTNAIHGRRHIEGGVREGHGEDGVEVLICSDAGPSEKYFRVSSVS